MNAAGTPDRILVLGCPGSGKTTLAKRVAERTGLPLFHLDDEHWGESWARPSAQEWADRQRELAMADRWVIDGNYLPGIPLRAVRAELVIILDVATPVCLRRILRRVRLIRRGDRSFLPARVRQSVDPVPASTDLVQLVRKVLAFRSRDFWQVVQAAHLNPAATVVIAASAGRTGLSVHRLRRGCQSRNLAAHVVRIRGSAAEQIPTALSPYLFVHGAGPATVG